MVALSTAIKANEARIQRSFVAVFVGGTAGIGSYALRSLAETHGHNGGDPRCYVVGRNAEAANALIATCKSACPSGNFRSISVADLSLIKNVDDCCKRIVAAEEQASGGVANFDVVLMTQGVLDFGDRKETSVGLDMSMSLLYYSRLRIVTNLMAFDSEQHSPTHFVSVYAGGLENKGKLNSSDLGLRQPGAYSFSSARTNITYMSTMMLEHFAKQLEGRASFVHVFPGVVVTAAMDAYSNPWWFK